MSLLQMLNNIGQGISFLLASLIVEDPSTHSNSTTITLPTTNSSTSPPPQLVVREELQHYLLLLSGPALATFVLVLCYFPSKPPTPPSRSSQVQGKE